MTDPLVGCEHGRKKLLPILILAFIVWPNWIFAQENLGPSAIFREVAWESGLHFEHFNGASGDFFLPEITGSGVALFDYDGDGDLDAYFVQGAILDKGKKLSEMLFPPKPGWNPGNRLFRNELVPTGKLGFTDVTEQAGVGDRGYGMGAAVGDYDGDADLDLYVTNLGPNVLYRNNGNGTFTDVTGTSPLKDPRWSSSAAFLDYDRDGDLDLFVANYLGFTVEGNLVCHTAGIRDYCAPSVYRPLPDRLFRNEGNGNFADVTEGAGMGAIPGAGMGVVCADFNSDGWIDLYVANDGTTNHLWINGRDGTFQEEALMAGTAYNVDGKVESSMGVTAADFDGDGDEDLLVTNLMEETHTLYSNNGSANFFDVTSQSQLTGVPNYTGWGTEWFDYDNDEDLDLFIANGAVNLTAISHEGEFPYDQTNQLFRNQGNWKYQEITLEAGPALKLSEVSRGAAFGDIDNDGDIDILVANNSGPARLLLNEIGSRRHWLQLHLEGAKGNRYGIGARVAVLREGQSSLWSRVRVDGSYLSSHDHRVHFGLGENLKVDAVQVYWPSGKREVWRQIGVDRLITLREGSGTPVERGEAVSANSTGGG